MNKEEFVKEQMKLSKEDIIANYWYAYQDNVERLGIEHQLNLKDKEIEKLQKDLRDAHEVIEQLKKDKRKVAKYIKEHENDLYDTYDGLPFGSIKGVKQILKLVTEVNDSNK